MNIYITVLSYFLVASLAFFIGFIISSIIRNIKSYSGIIKIIPEEEKLIYSLELHEDPIMLQHMNEVVFKVETSDESSDRN